MNATPRDNTAMFDSAHSAARRSCSFSSFSGSVFIITLHMSTNWMLSCIISRPPGVGNSTLQM